MRLVGLVTLLATASLCYADAPPAEQTEKKTPRWQKNFEKRDKNNDGKLDKEEFKSKAFARFDENKDGFVSLEEYKKFHQARRKHQKNKGQRKRKVYPKQWLKARDKNGDGKLGKDEYKGKVDIFGRFDTDKDGFLSLEEIRKMPRFQKKWKNKGPKKMGHKKRDKKRDKRHIKPDEPKSTEETESKPTEETEPVGDE